MTHSKLRAIALVFTLVVIAVTWFVTGAVKIMTPHGSRRFVSLPPDPGDFTGIELTGADLRELDLRDKGEFLLAKADFDTLTVWPARLPRDLTPGISWRRARIRVSVSGSFTEGESQAKESQSVSLTLRSKQAILLATPLVLLDVIIWPACLSFQLHNLYPYAI